ncbi:hypothetical protein JTB14_015407 [Gonioctena quinquepunctata]|nr:hypothetical protein JTB14_015407 [Gonioctena quinquepunctata]
MGCSSFSQKDDIGPNGTIDNGEKNNFCAEEFVERLETEGLECPYDDNTEYPRGVEELPHFYNEKLFKRGQEFFRKHTVGIFLGCYLALIAGFSHRVSKVLVMTKRTSTPLTAYRRYSETILHMCTWYESDLKSGSKLWSSVRRVREIHNHVNKLSKCRINYQMNQNDLSMTIMGFMGLALVRSEMVGIHHVSEDEWKGFIHFWRVMGYFFGIEDRLWSSVRRVREIHNHVNKLSKCRINYQMNQNDLSMTIMGFMGLALVRSEMVGIHHVSEDEWKGFIHFWRVMGYFFGIEDRFNFCMDSVEETKAVCNLLMQNVAEITREKGDNFEMLTRAFIEGMRGIMPVFYYDITIDYLQKVLGISPDPKARRNVSVDITSAMRYNIVRILMNHALRFVLWLLKVCPIFAYMKFGIQNSHIRI